jgi:hypothetical protein
MIIFFALDYNGWSVDWWGTSASPLLSINHLAVSNQGVDVKGYSWFEVPKEGFGPGIGEFE